jgi:glutamate formiminotransferase/formiminotetrahydrofolate cyclodeaminase
MPRPLIECIPNFSEARRPEVVDQIIAAITNVPDIHLLDKHSDHDHNRTVVTFVGTPEAVEEAAFQGIKIAGQLINLDEHTGEHPRLGATDVVPFVPISDVTMVECVEIARRLGKRVADELSIPVYLYEEAAATEERKNLENIRRGQYEAIKAEIETKPERKPDFGPCKVGPAGAVVIGAREPLIAYNIYLNTDNVQIAQKIGRAVRHSSGGLRFVKAMGIIVDGQAQVSMNLTNFRKTPIARVVEMVRREAARYGVMVTYSELVGLIPQDALVNAAKWYLQLDKFDKEQILESRISESENNKKQATGKVEDSFIDELASGAPTPGGGSAAAHSGAAAAALVAMVARLTIGKKKYASVEKEMWAMLEKAETLRKSFTEAVERDAEAFNGFMRAMKLPKGTEAEQTIRESAIQEATLKAALVPLEVAKMSVETMVLAAQAAEQGNANAISDAGTASAMAKAALTGASLNVRINAQGLNDENACEELLSELKSLEQKAGEFDSTIRRTLEERGGLTLSI